MALEEMVRSNRIDSPIGEIKAFMRTTAPYGYLACDGSTYNIADYQELADMFLNEFGARNKFGGNGTTTFKVPDLRGEFLRGTGTNGATSISGANVGTHQNGTYHPHIFGCKGKTSSIPTRIDFGWNSNQLTGSDSNFDYMSSWNTDKDLGRTNNLEVMVNTVGTISASSWGSFMSRPTNTSVLYCIRAY